MKRFGFRFRIDGAGNTVTDSRNGGTVYAYDSAGRLASVTTGGVLQATYRYDVLGRQVLRTLVPSGVTIQSIFDSQGRRVAEYDQGTGALIREYVWLDWEPLAVIEGGAIFYVRADHVGRPVFATNATGAKVWTMSFDPFGTLIASTGNPIAARFPGQWFQAESGLHQNRVRDYDPTTGRYIQPDPLGLIDGSSIYGYAWQNPGRWVDPRGTYTTAATGPLAGLICASNPLCDAALVVAACGIGVYAIYEWWNYDPPLVSSKKAPGEPGPEDGYEPPRRWDGRKVRNPNGSGYGYPDSKGDVWIPSGEGGSRGSGTSGIAHGGPHWDVQSPGGGYRNVFPKPK